MQGNTSNKQTNLIYIQSRMRMRMLSQSYKYVKTHESLRRWDRLGNLSFSSHYRQDLSKLVSYTE